MNVTPHKAFQLFKGGGTYSGTELEFETLWKNEVRALLKFAHGDLNDRWVAFADANSLSSCVGIHLRRTDAVTWRSKWVEKEFPNLDELDARLLAAVADRMRLPGVTGIFVASDSRMYQERWTRQLLNLGFRVVCWPAQWHSRFRQTAGDDVLADLMSLTTCAEIYASFHSSILMLARAFDIPITFPPRRPDDLSRGSFI